MLHLLQKDHLPFSFTIIYPSSHFRKCGNHYAYQKFKRFEYEFKQFEHNYYEGLQHEKGECSKREGEDKG